MLLAKTLRLAEDTGALKKSDMKRVTVDITVQPAHSGEHHLPDQRYVDKGYRGHDVPRPWRIFKSGQKRGVVGRIKRELRRRSAVEAVIGHCKTDGIWDGTSCMDALAITSTPSCDRRRL